MKIFDKLLTVLFIIQVIYRVSQGNRVIHVPVIKQYGFEAPGSAVDEKASLAAVTGDANCAE